MGSEIRENDIFSKLIAMGCHVMSFDVAEMIAPESLWEFPFEWLRLPFGHYKLPEIVAALAQSHTIFVSPQSFHGFAPTAVASAFCIEGDIDISKLFTGLKDQLPDDVLNEHVETQLLVCEPEYICAKLCSRFTVEHHGEMMDFESITMYDLYLVPEGSHVLLQRTIITSYDDPAPIPLFSDARPPQ